MLGAWMLTHLNARAVEGVVGGVLLLVCFFQLKLHTRLGAWLKQRRYAARNGRLYSPFSRTSATGAWPTCRSSPHATAGTEQDAVPTEGRPQSDGTVLIDCDDSPGDAFLPGPSSICLDPAIACEGSDEPKAATHKPPEAHTEPALALIIDCGPAGELEGQPLVPAGAASSSGADPDRAAPPEPRGRVRSATAHMRRWLARQQWRQAGRIMLLGGAASMASGLMGGEGAAWRDGAAGAAHACPAAISGCLYATDAVAAGNGVFVYVPPNPHVCPCGLLPCPQASRGSEVRRLLSQATPRARAQLRRRARCLAQPGALMRRTPAPRRTARHDLSPQVRRSCCSTPRCGSRRTWLAPPTPGATFCRSRPNPPARRSH
jgi:hypothetical protein